MHEPELFKLTQAYLRRYLYFVFRLILMPMSNGAVQYFSLGSPKAVLDQLNFSHAFADKSEPQLIQLLICAISYDPALKL